MTKELFKKWRSIENFRTFYTEITRWLSHPLNEEPGKYTFAAKVKLHGTNAGLLIHDNKLVPQKRSQIISIENDNFGFAVFAHKLTTELAYLKFDFARFEGWRIYGEWAGSNIQKGVACALVDKFFAIFAVEDPEGNIHYSRGRQVDATDLIVALCENGCYYIPIHFRTEIDFRSQESLENFQKFMDGKIAEMDTCDPYMKETFGVIGPGEGYVMYADDQKGGLYMFKVKSDKFKEISTKSSTDVKYTVSLNDAEFIRSICTDYRLEKILHEMYPDGFDIKGIGPYIKAVTADIVKECQNEIAEYGVELNRLNKTITKMAADYYKKQLSFIDAKDHI